VRNSINLNRIIGENNIIMQMVMHNKNKVVFKIILIN